MNKTIFFPAFSGLNHLETVNKMRNVDGTKSFNFFNKSIKSVFTYPFLLISAAYGIKNDKFKQYLDINNTTILGDSGGYQIATKVIENTEENKIKIFNWLENHTTYAVNLDIPPFGGYGDRDNVKRFESALSETVSNMKYFEKNQSGKTKYLNCLHGTNLQELNLWYSNIKDFNFSGGWSCGSHFGKFYRILLDFFFLYEKGELKKNSGKDNLLHFLGYSRNHSLPYVMYLQNKLNISGIDLKISSDSASFCILATYGKYALYAKRDGTSTIHFSNKTFVENADINFDLNLPCSCPCCKNVKYNYFLTLKNEKGGFKQEFYDFVSIHNLYKFLEYKLNMENIILSNNKLVFESFFSEKDMNIFSLIDKAFESESPTDVICKHKHIIDTADVEDDEIENKNLSNFMEF